ncbi:MAG: hypothetical protein AMJ62_16130 [Myxococcales bacterium SG8_38]|nr:MAG: hypothetical protein AMJ62_16130 [Myxococcales bacterium SG8_38]
MPSLSEIDDGLWTTAVPLRFWGVETGARMTIVRLRDGGLFVHSPLWLDATLKAEIDSVGPVTAVVAPSLFHHLWVTPWRALDVRPGPQSRAAALGTRSNSRRTKGQRAADPDLMRLYEAEAECTLVHGVGGVRSY